MPAAAKAKVDNEKTPGTLRVTRGGSKGRGSLGELGPGFAGFAGFV
jgi:hypothetical protein